MNFLLHTKMKNGKIDYCLFEKKIQKEKRTLCECISCILVGLFVSLLLNILHPLLLHFLFTFIRPLILFSLKISFQLERIIAMIEYEHKKDITKLLKKKLNFQYS